MFSVDLKVGRLLEIRLVGSTPVPADDVDRTRQWIRELFQKMSGKLVCIADLAQADVLPQDAATKLLEVFRADNPRIERSGLLVSDASILSLQIERLVAQAGNPARRCFRDPFELKTFLGSVLEHEEHLRMAQF